MDQIHLRDARPDDSEDLAGLIRDLARHDGTLADVDFTSDQLRAALTGPAPKLRAILATTDDRVVGFITYTIDFAIWINSDVIRVDDLFVRAESRGKGIGRRLMREIARRAVAGDMGARWEVVPGNETAQAFYRQLGAELRQKVIARWDLPAMTNFLALSSSSD